MNTDTIVMNAKFAHFFLVLDANQDYWYTNQVKRYLTYLFSSPPQSIYIELYASKKNNRQTISQAVVCLLFDIIESHASAQITIDLPFMTTRDFLSNKDLQKMAAKKNCRLIIELGKPLRTNIPDSLGLGLRLSYQDLGSLFEYEEWFYAVEHLELVYPKAGIGNKIWSQLSATLLQRFIPHSFHNFYKKNISSKYMEAIYTNKPYLGLSFVPRKSATSFVSMGSYAVTRDCVCSIVDSKLRLAYKTCTLADLEYISFLLMNSSQNRQGLTIDQATRTLFSSAGYSETSLFSFLRSHGYRKKNGKWIRNPELWYNYCIPDL